MSAVILASASDQTDLKVFVAKVTPKMQSAYLTGDSKFFDSLFSPDFTSKDERGVKLGRKESLFILRYQFSTVKLTACTAKAIVVNAANGQGTVKSTCAMVGLTPARHGQPPQNIRIMRTFNDTYRKVGKAWLLVHREDATQPIIKLLPVTAKRP